MARPYGAMVSMLAHWPHMATISPMHEAALSMALAHRLSMHLGCMSNGDANLWDLEVFSKCFK
jgi:class 4 POU domain transcription factor